jgi:heavy metal sensor kinase
MNRQSIRTRLTIWYTAVLSLAIVLFSGVVSIALRHLLYNDLQTTLLNQSRGLEEYLRIEDQDRSMRLLDEIDEYSRSLLHPHLLAISGEAGQIIYENFPGVAGQIAKSRRQRINKPQEFSWEGKHYWALSRPVSLREGTFQTFLAISSESVDRAVRLLAFLLVVAVPVFIICGAVGGYWLSRRALSPVDRITEAARTIGVTNLSERLAVPATNDELQRLAETWNDMLQRLEIAVSQISQFTADASHELRTPVAIIRLAAENALRKRRSESEYRQALQKIQSESESMTQLIENLLFLARADVNRLSIDLEMVDIRTLVETACLDLSPLAEEKSIALIQNVPGSPLPVLGNYSALRRMLIILLDNAIKYTPAGGKVSVGLREHSGKAVLTVEDTGIGIPEEAQSRVFQRFFRVDSSRNKESGGYGLGLAIAQTIVNQHEASIELQSKSSGGCVFSIALRVIA